MKLKIVHKIPALLTVPLVFLLGFIALVTQMKRENESAQEWSLHSKEVIAQCQLLTGSLVRAESDMRARVIAGSPVFAESYQQSARDAEETARRLVSLVQDNPGQAAAARNLSSIASQSLQSLARKEQLIASGEIERAAEQIRRGAGIEIMGAFRRNIDAFLAEEERLDALRLRQLVESWRRFDWLLWGSGSADALPVAFRPLAAISPD